MIPLHNLELTTVHELGHAVDHAADWAESHSVDFTRAMRESIKGLKGFERRNAQYFTSDPKEAFAELYALAHNPNRDKTQRYFGGMKQARAEEAFAAPLAQVRRVKSLSLLAMIRAGNECHEPAGSPEGGQFCGEGGGGSGAAEPTSYGASDFNRSKVDIAANDIETRDRIISIWNRYVRKSPAEFKRDFLGGLPGTMVLSTLTKADRDSLNFYGVLRDKEDSPATNTFGVKIGSYNRVIAFDTKIAYGSSFKVDKKEQGHDVGKRFMAGNVAEYKRMGIEKVSIRANVDVGGYAWPRYGYVLTSNEAGRQGLKRDFEVKAEKLILDGKIGVTEYQGMVKLIESDNPKALWALADSSHGKDLLLGTAYYADLNLMDPDAMRRFDAYISKAKAR